MRCFRFIIFGSFRPLASCCDRWFSPKASSGLAACLFCVAFALFCGTETGQPAKQTGSLPDRPWYPRSEEHTSELQSRGHLVCRLLLEKKKQTRKTRKSFFLIFIPSKMFAAVWLT